MPGFYIIHAINAWDEEAGNAIEMVAPNILSVEHTLERMELVHALVEKVRIDLNTGIVKRLVKTSIVFSSRVVLVTIWIQLNPAVFSLTYSPSFSFLFFIFLYVNSNFTWIHYTWDKNHYSHIVYHCSQHCSRTKK